MSKVLVVDDEHNIRSILDFSLVAEGFEVLEASDGEEAFETAVAERPDLIILDVMMPKSDGVDVCRRLKQDDRTSTIPVIMLTARSTRQDRQHGQAAGADAYITKPFSPTKVVDTVQSLLGVRRS